MEFLAGASELGLDISVSVLAPRVGRGVVFETRVHGVLLCTVVVLCLRSLFLVPSHSLLLPALLRYLYPTQFPIGVWCVDNVTDFSYTFDGVSLNEPLTGWKTSKATTMAYMFRHSTFNQPLRCVVCDCVCVCVCV